ncbi:polysaccharide deacetylase family protein [Vibrio methylphosphonaticus]|uniref:polysaccharide deacetylase family protein n=1 Tax=Vibrio methylphosphonaticus TaxID=2946866 RepID=UPI002029E749|nr:polysaccharide deacetylase family protein [Vibrio methylphosphonaticus]MCL9775474.1 polysaccharide deacetylase family protein [Vibrio methylphosphonaticus]
MKVLTFDIEDWFHILDNPSTKEIDQWKKFESRLSLSVDRILNALEDRDQKATFFILGWVAEQHPEVVHRIIDSGHEIGTHSYGHQLAYNQSRQEFGEDLGKSIAILENISGEKVKAYRAPGFSIVKNNTWAFEILVENGIEVDSSIFPANRSHGGLPDFESSEPCIGSVFNKELKLFPINSKSFLGRSFIYSGGGYFRLFPEKFLRYCFSHDDYIMTYFHPRDFDPEQPVLEGLNFLRRFKSYVGLNGALAKLELILDENEFVSLDKAVDTVDWTSVKKYQFK